MSGFRRVSVLCALLGLVVAIVSCGDERRADSPTVPVSLPDFGAKLDDEAQDYLEQLWCLENPECSGSAREVDMVDALRGMVDVKDGGYLFGVPPGWPPDYSFSILVPQGAILPESLPDPEADAVEIFIRVPAIETVFSSFNDAMPIVFGTDGLQFDPANPARVVLCYHPALKPLCGDYCFHSADRDGGIFYAAEAMRVNPEILGGKEGMPVPGTVPSDPRPITDCAKGITAWIQHFSRWELEKECCDERCPVCPCEPLLPE